MLNRKLSTGFSPQGGAESHEMRRRIAGCRERLRRGRAAQTIARRAPEPFDGPATGEAEAVCPPAHAAHGEEETEREP
jgi:hypothetical protein